VGVTPGSDYAYIEESAVAEVAARMGLDASGRELVSSVDRRVSPADAMWVGDGAHYLGVGMSAIEQINAAIRVVSPDRVRSVLDFPCGHGRVTRFLERRFPEAELSACDIDADGVEFCQNAFDARGQISAQDLDQLSLARRFDIIWCGSLLTHFDSRNVLATLRFLHRSLRDGGLLVITTHGSFSLEKLRTATWTYGLDAGGVARVVESCDSTGFGYEDYPDASGYGTSVALPAWIRASLSRAGGLEERYFAARGWDHHQDVYGVVRVSQTVGDAMGTGRRRLARLRARVSRWLRAVRRD
jgi:SAM-dependent methyltransferase